MTIDGVDAPSDWRTAPVPDRWIENLVRSAIVAPYVGLCFCVVVDVYRTDDPLAVLGLLVLTLPWCGFPLEPIVNVVILWYLFGWMYQHAAIRTRSRTSQESSGRE